MFKLLFRKSEKVGEAGEVITFDLDTKTLNDVKYKAATTLRNKYKSSLRYKMREEIKEALFKSYKIEWRESSQYDLSQKEADLVDAIINDMISELDLIGD